MRSRAGKTSLGCLFTLLIVSAALYFGVHAGDAYWRYLQYRDAMRAEVRFRGHLSDERIRTNLRRAADSLGLPPGAGEVSVKREGREVTISAEYDELVDMPLFKREIHFHPSASGTY